MREYNTANGFTAVVRTHPAKLDKRHVRGKNLAKDLDDAADTSMSSSFMSVPKPVYNTPAKCIRAAEQVVAELSGLSGETLVKQQGRLQELLATAGKLNAKMKKAHPSAPTGIIHSGRGAGRGGSDVQASSPNRAGGRARVGRKRSEERRVGKECRL